MIVGEVARIVIPKLLVVVALTTYAEIPASDQIDLGAGMRDISSVFADPQTKTAIVWGPERYAISKDCGISWSGPHGLRGNNGISGAMVMDGMIVIHSTDGDLLVNGLKVASKVEALRGGGQKIFYQTLENKIYQYPRSDAMTTGSLIASLDDMAITKSSDQYASFDGIKSSRLKLMGPEPTSFPRQSGPAFNVTYDREGKSYELKGGKLICTGDLKMTILSQLTYDYEGNGIFLTEVSNKTSPSFFKSRTKSAAPHPVLVSPSTAIAFLGIKDGRKRYLTIDNNLAKIIER